MTDWRWARLDWIAREVRGTIDPKALGMDAVFHYSIPVMDELGDGALESASDIGSNKLKLSGGEVLISKLNPRITRVFRAEAHDVPTISSTEFIALVPEAGLESRFLCYWLTSEATRQRLDGATLSVTRSQQRVRPDILTGTWLRLPPVGQQRAIADYLDADTARIDALIDNKRRMVELLEERFLEEVRFRVTGGLLVRDPLHVRMAEVGKVGWKPVKLGSNLRFGSGTTPTAGDQRYYSDGSVPWLVTGELRDRPVTGAARTVTSEALADFPALRIHPAGALLVAMYGATVGRLGITMFPAAVNQACCVMHSGQRVDTWFLFYYLLSHRSVLIERSVGAGQPNISQDILRALRIAAPEVSEQAQIVAGLAADSARMERLATPIRRQLDLLAERRQALITAAVTGELDIAA